MQEPLGKQEENIFYILAGVASVAEVARGAASSKECRNLGNQEEDIFIYIYLPSVGVRYIDISFPAFLLHSSLPYRSCALPERRFLIRRWSRRAARTDAAPASRSDPPRSCPGTFLLRP